MKSWSSPSLPTIPVTTAGGPVRVHDTASGQVIPVGAGDGTARLYVCGITPYDATHMGHAATYVTFDLLQRAWADAGYSVTYVQNVTDVDEPLLERAQRDGVHWEDLAEREIALFFEDMEALRVLAPAHYVGAVEGIPDDVTAIEELLADGSAYRVALPQGEEPVEGASDHDIYLDLSTQPSFGAVSGWTREEMLAVFADRGGDPDREGKRDRLDPLLWRAGRDGEPHWPGGNLGHGRPGWHIECSTIAQRYLGIDFDVQGGGTDLVFPHHEMSAVQAAAMTEGQRFARAYVHQAMVGLDGEKMSKSKGNLVLVSRLRQSGVDPMAIRLALLDHHYRGEWEWTDQDLERAQARLEVWRDAAAAVSARGRGANQQTGETASAQTGTAAGPERQADDEDTLAQLRERLSDDLDAPGALRVVDAWAERVVRERGVGEGEGTGSVGTGSEGSGSEGSGSAAAVLGTAHAGLVPTAVDALLGIAL